jgi:hypothetical protein
MKYVIFILALSLLSCSKNTRQSSPPPSNNGKALLVSLDYQSYRLVGAQEINLKRPFVAGDSLDLLVDLKPAGDFGHLGIFHRDNTDTVFFGTVIWAGNGQRYFPPAMQDSNSLAQRAQAIAAPADSLFQFLEAPGPVPGGSYPQLLWPAAAKLQLVHDYYQPGQKVAVFAYQPGIGAGNPDYWRWYLVFLKS